MAKKLPKKIGKAKAREEFSYLVEQVSKGGGIVEITDYGKTAAILISEEEYKWLCSSKKSTEPKRNARGILQLKNADDLYKAQAEVLKDFEESLESTASKL